MNDNITCIPIKALLYPGSSIIKKDKVLERTYAWSYSLFTSFRLHQIYIF